MTRNVFLCMPSYDQHEVEMMQAAYRRYAPEDRLGDYFVRAEPRKGCSLLACAFNEGWVSCLNSWKEWKWDYWLLLHGDVEPSDGFVHHMIEELEAHDLDALHACVAIKDARGITSTALGPMKHKWSCSRKITTTELQQLPQTFTVDDCLQFLDWPEGSAFDQLIRKRCDTDPHGLCMLPNTGCLLVKVKDWCWEFPGFRIEDRLVEYREDGSCHLPVSISPETRHATCVNGDYADHEELSTERGRRMCQNVPEDWGFGRWCARKGLKVGATTKVTTRHWGKYVFVSQYPWGGEKIDHWFFGCKEQLEP